jgi:hypothetical protein
LQDEIAELQQLSVEAEAPMAAAVTQAGVDKELCKKLYWKQSTREVFVQLLR